MNAFSELPEKISNSLIEAGITTVNALMFTENWILLDLPGIGKATLKKIRKIYGPSFFNQPTIKQAELLDLPIEEIFLTKIGAKWLSPHSSNLFSPEEVILDLYINDGWEGSYLEGYPLRLLQDAACQHIVEKDMEESFAPDRWLWLACNKGTLRDLIKPSINVCEIMLRKNLEILMRFRSLFGTYNGAELDIEFLIRLWKTIGREIFKQILELQIDDRGKPQYYTGWSDLTLIKENELQFVEVKTNDRIHKSQLETFCGIFKKLKLSLRIVVLKPITNRR